MKAQEHWFGDLRNSPFEVNLEAGINALFRRCPDLCGFTVRDSGGLMVTEISVYPLSGVAPPAELCREIVITLGTLIDECPEVTELLRERTFARVFH